MSLMFFVVSVLYLPFLDSFIEPLKLLSGCESLSTHRTFSPSSDRPVVVLSGGDHTRCFSTVGTIFYSHYFSPFHNSLESLFQLAVGVVKVVQSFLYFVPLENIRKALP